MRYPLFLCMLVSVLLISSCGNDKPNPNEPENPPGKTELWSKDKIVREEYKSGNGSISRVYTYDSQGREISYVHYIDNKLFSENKNYSYNGLICTYDYYLEGTYGCKTTIEFYDESWNNGKIRNYSTVFKSGSSSRTEYQYDDQDRLIGVKSYTNNTLILERKNYQYGDNRWSCDMYNNPSSLLLISITEYTYDDTETIKREYLASTPNSYREWCYDNEGREVGYIEYQDEKVIYEYKNYVYNGKVCTYDTYSNGTQTSTVLIEYY